MMKLVSLVVLLVVYQKLQINPYAQFRHQDIHGQTWHFMHICRTWPHIRKVWTYVTITSSYQKQQLHQFALILKQRHLCYYRSFFSGGSFLQRPIISALQASCVSVVQVPAANTSSTTAAHVLRQNARNGEMRTFLSRSPCRINHRDIWHKFLIQYEISTSLQN